MGEVQPIEQVNLPTKSRSDMLAEQLTYFVSQGVSNRDRDSIYFLWKGICKAYEADLKNERDDEIPVDSANRQGKHVIKDSDEDMASEPVLIDKSKAKQYFEFAQTVFDGKRRVEESEDILIKDVDAPGIYKYEELSEMGGERGRTYRSNVQRANLKFHWGEDPNWGFYIQIKKNLITVKTTKDDLPKDSILELRADDQGTHATVFVDTSTGSRKTITVPSRSTFATIKNGLLWSNVYPYPSAISGFMNGHDTEFKFDEKFEGLDDTGAITEDPYTGEIRIKE